MLIAPAYTSFAVASPIFLTFIITGIPPIVAGSVVTDIILSLATFGISRVGIAVGLVVIVGVGTLTAVSFGVISLLLVQPEFNINIATVITVSYTHLRAHETRHDL